MIGGLLNLNQASQQNQATQDAMDVNTEYHQLRGESLWKNYHLLLTDTGDAAALEDWKLSRQVHAMRGRILASAAQAGVSTGAGSYAQIIQQTFAEEGMNKMIMARNLESRQDQLWSQYEAGIIENDAQFNLAMAQLDYQMQSPLLSAFGGGISGYGAGLEIFG